MKKGAKLLIGTHDFSTFRASSCGAKSPIKTIEKVIIKKNKDKITLKFISKSFLQQQVRSMVGCIKYLGEGKWSIDKFQKALINSSYQWFEPKFSSSANVPSPRSDNAFQLNIKLLNSIAPPASFHLESSSGRVPLDSSGPMTNASNDSLLRLEPSGGFHARGNSTLWASTAITLPIVGFFGCAMTETEQAARAVVVRRPRALSMCCRPWGRRAGVQRWAPSAACWRRRTSGCARSRATPGPRRPC